MYREDPLPAYFVNGEGSAYVDMNSAIPLLCQYCANLPSDVYTSYVPEWYIQTKSDSTGDSLRSVVILLPIICPIREPIEVRVAHIKFCQTLLVVTNSLPSSLYLVLAKTGNQCPTTLICRASWIICMIQIQCFLFMKMLGKMSAISDLVTIRKLYTVA